MLVAAVNFLKTEKIFMELRHICFNFVSMSLRIYGYTEEKWSSWIYDALCSTVWHSKTTDALNSVNYGGLEFSGYVEQYR